MSELKRLQNTHGGQWLYVKATRKGEAVWRSNSGLIARKPGRDARVIIARAAIK